MEKKNCTIENFDWKWKKTGTIWKKWQIFVKGEDKCTSYAFWVGTIVSCGASCVNNITMRCIALSSNTVYTTDETWYGCTYTFMHILLLSNIFIGKEIAILIGFINIQWNLYKPSHQGTQVSDCTSATVLTFWINNILKFKIVLYDIDSATSHHNIYSNVSFINHWQCPNTPLLFYVFVGRNFGLKCNCIFYATVPCNMKRTYKMLLWIFSQCHFVFINKDITGVFTHSKLTTFRNWNRIKYILHQRYIWYSGTCTIRHLSFPTSCHNRLKFMVPKYFCELK